MDKVNLGSGGGFVQSRGLQMLEPSSSPARTLSSQADFSLGDRVQVLGQRGVRHAASGVGGMLGLAPNGLGHPRCGSPRRGWP
jgi:hypothetical protein